MWQHETSTWKREKQGSDGCVGLHPADGGESMAGDMEPLQAAETEMLPGACAKGSGIKPATRPEGIWVLFKTAEPLARPTL